MYTPDISASDLAAYAGFWSWCAPAQEQRLNMIRDRALGPNTYANMNAIDAEIYARKRVAAIEAFATTPEIKAYLLASVRERGSQAPVATDYTTTLKSAVERARNGHGTALGAYTPEPGACGIKLLPARGVHCGYRQESYSDDSEIAIPYAVTEGKPADKAVFARNVSALVRRLNSHNGYAGSGCTYEASVRDGFVIVHCRASISD